ncbi:MAG: ABC transporter permease [Candidatus Hodarchaeales archaeon]|jgi:peptide/nickel transport system permease protein
MKYRYYVLQRILLLIPVIIGVTVVTYFIAHEAGDPIAAYISPTQLYTLEEKAELKRQLGLDKPILDRYLLYLNRLINGDWGISRTSQNKPVLSAIAELLPATAELSSVALIFAVGLGIPFGIISAVRKDSYWDHITRIISLIGVSIPAFWMGLMIQILIFNFNMSNDIFGELPINFRYDFDVYDYDPITGFLLIDSILTGNLRLWFDAFVHLAPAAFTLGWASMALISRMTRMAMIETMKEDYILLAKAKGLKERTIIYRHALRNAIIPTLTVAGLTFAGLLTGSVLIETVFDWPGIGKWAVDAIFVIDLASILGFTITITILYVISNLVIDLMYAWVDPRITID